MVSQHSLRLWQPMLAMSLKENFVKTNARKIAARCELGWTAVGVPLTIVSGRGAVTKRAALLSENALCAASVTPMVPLSS